MFGALLGLFGLGVAGIEAARDSMDDSIKRSDSIASGGKTYIDHKCRTRSNRTNNIVVTREDKDGYKIKVDIKTGEILDQTHRKNCEEATRIDKERCRRMGLLTYFDTQNRENGRIEPKEKRVCDDLPVDKYMSGNYCIPIFHLMCGKDTNHLYGYTEEDLVIENRRRVLDYCYQWYVNGDIESSMPHPSKMIDAAKKYNIFIYPEDIQFGLKKVKEGTIREYQYQNVDSDFWDRSKSDTRDYRYADWCDSKHWIENPKCL